MSYWNSYFFKAVNGFMGQNRALDMLGFVLADRLTYILAFLALFFVFFRRTWKQRIFLGGEMLIAAILSRGIITEAIRFFYHHDRPFFTLGFEPLFVHDPAGSFPSGHTSALFAVGLIIFFYSRRFGIAFLLASLLVGVGRIYAGIHWPLDVAGGIAVGLLSASLVHILTKGYWTMLHPSLPKENAPDAPAL